MVDVALANVLLAFMPPDLWAERGARLLVRSIRAANTPEEIDMALQDVLCRVLQVDGKVVADQDLTKCLKGLRKAREIGEEDVIDSALAICWLASNDEPPADPEQFCSWLNERLEPRPLCLSRQDPAAA